MSRSFRQSHKKIKGSPGYCDNRAKTEVYLVTKMWSQKRLNLSSQFIWCEPLILSAVYQVLVLQTQRKTSNKLDHASQKKLLHKKHTIIIIITIVILRIINIHNHTHTWSAEYQNSNKDQKYRCLNGFSLGTEEEPQLKKKH